MGRYLFMHNGVVAGFMAIRRELLAQLRDAAYNAVQSFHSDSAVSFALFLNHLPDLEAPQPPEAILRALQATIATITRIQAATGIIDVSLLNYVVSDGATLVATRFVSHEGDAPASLYYAEGSSYQRSSTQGEVSRKVSAAASALNAGGGEQGAAGARSKSVTGERGEGRRGERGGRRSQPPRLLSGRLCRIISARCSQGSPCLTSAPSAPPPTTTLLPPQARATTA